MTETQTRIHDAVLTLRIPEELLEELRVVKVRDGIPVSEQVRRALALWFASQKKGKK